MDDKGQRRKSREDLEPPQARATRSPEMGDTSLAADAISPQSGLPFGKLPVEFGRYRIEKLLGAGAMGAVYLATDSQLDRQVAIKVPKLSKSGSPALLGRMEREAKALAQLDHPNLCKIYDFNVIDGVRFIALEYVQGETLKSLLQRLGRKRKVSDAVAMTVQLARALGAAHEKGVVHRDLKPENIMRRPDGRLVIMDFGLNNRQSQLGEEAAHKTQQGTILGTPAYMSPEQAAGRLEEVDQRSDIYALGVMLYEMLTGELPFSGTAMEIMGRKTILPAPSPLSVNEKLPPELAGICERMLAQKPENRTATCAEIVKALKACDLTARAVVADPSGTLAAPSNETGDQFEFVRDPESVDTSPKKKPVDLPPRRSKPPRDGSRWLAGVTGWWRSQPLSMQFCLVGAAAVVLAIAGMIFLRTDHGTLQVEIDDPSISVKIAGSTITVDNDGQPIQISATSPQTLEVLQNGVAVESASRQITLHKGEKRLVRISRLEGQIAIDGTPVAPAGDEFSPFQGSAQTASSDPSRMATILNPGGTWKIEGDVLWLLNVAATGRAAEQWLLFGDPSWTDYTFSFEAQHEEGLSGLTAVIRSPDDDHFLHYGYGWQSGQTALAESHEFGSFYKTWEASRPHPDPIRSGHWYKIRVEVEGQTSRFYCDDRLILESRNTFYDHGRVGIRTWRPGPGRTGWRNFQVVGRNGQTLWSGLPALGPAGETTPRSVPTDALRPAGGSLPAVSAGPPADAVIYDRRRYKLFAGNPTWREAEARCREMGGRLAIIRNRSENDFLYGLAKGSPLDAIWLGATDEAREGVWLWGDGEGLAFNNFSNGQPNNSGDGEDFLVMTLRDQPGEWSDQPNRSLPYLMGFVCEWGPQDSGDSDGWVSLFNGQDLRNWRTHPSQPGGWSVRNGILTGIGTTDRPITHLYTERDNYRNFELSAICRMNNAGNSGIYFRSSFGPLVLANSRNWPAGYEAQIYFGQAGTQTGGLYAFDGKNVGPVVSATNSAVRGGEWISLHIVAADARIVVRVDGKVISDYVDPEDRFKRGCIALQVHDAQTSVEFRTIRVRELKPGGVGGLDPHQPGQQMVSSDDAQAAAPDGPVDIPSLLLGLPNSPGPQETVVDDPQQPRKAPSAVVIPRPKGTETVSFSRDIAPWFTNLCLGCHSRKMHAGGLSLETFEDLMQGGASGPVIIPGDRKNSRLFRLVGGLENPRMPQGVARITRPNYDALVKWFDEGNTFDGDDPRTSIRDIAAAVR